MEKDRAIKLLCKLFKHEINNFYKRGYELEEPEPIIYYLTEDELEIFYDYFGGFSWMVLL